MGVFFWQTWIFCDCYCCNHFWPLEMAALFKTFFSSCNQAALLLTSFYDQYASPDHFHREMHLEENVCLFPMQFGFFSIAVKGLIMACCISVSAQIQKNLSIFIRAFCSSPKQVTRANANRLEKIGKRSTLVMASSGHYAKGWRH